MTVAFCSIVSSYAQSPVDVMRGRVRVAKTDTLVDARKVPPRYPGGNEAMIDFIAYHIKYPKSLRKKKYNIGPITVKFLVQSDGKVNDVTVTSRPTPPDVAEEMSDYVTNIRKVFLKMPRWEPARVNGTPINYQYALPFQVEIPK